MTGTWDEINEQDLIDGDDWDLAGWRDDGFDDNLQLPDQELAEGELGCTASRIFLAEGSLLSTIKSYYEEETDWIFAFDWESSIEVESGWKRW